MQVELLFPIVATLFLTAGQLYLAPVGLAFVSRCGPASARSTAIGIWFLAGGIAGLIAGRVGTLYSSWSAPSFFFLLAWICALDAAILRWGAPGLERAAIIVSHP